MALHTTQRATQNGSTSLLLSQSPLHKESRNAEDRREEGGSWLNACEELEEEDNPFFLTRIVEIGLVGSAKVGLAKWIECRARAGLELESDQGMLREEVHCVLKFQPGIPSMNVQHNGSDKYGLLLKKN